MNHLVPCPECHRHVRVSETECPFCGRSLDLAGSPEPVLPRERLSRAATFAFSATLASATALAACSGTDAPVPVYGGPPAEGGAANVAGGAGTGAAGSSNGVGGAPVAVYGAPAAGGLGTGNTGSNDAGGGPIPVYGAAP